MNERERPQEPTADWRSSDYIDMLKNLSKISKEDYDLHYDFDSNSFYKASSKRKKLSLSQEIINQRKMK